MLVTSKRVLSIVVIAAALSACGGEKKSSTSKEKAGGQAASTMAAQANGELQAARQAFWQRDMTEAEKQYQALVKEDSATADAWGELGNVYYAQGKWQEAAAAYAEAALRLIENKNMGQAMHLHQVVAGMDAEQAKRIDEKLRAEFTAQTGQ